MTEYMERYGICEKDAILCAMSGGVDSTIAAYMLKESFDVPIIGATHYIWPDSRCCSLDVTDRARATCEKLGIPYHVIDLQEEFRRYVVDNFVETYLEGKTPNPCILCNEKIRFDIFYNTVLGMLKKDGILKEGGRLFMATGHYARTGIINGKVFLKRGVDPVKDQSYMLYRLSGAILSRLILPLGGYRKSEIFAIAEKLGLAVRHVAESQDACFVGESYSDFILKEARDKIGERVKELSSPGPIVTVDGKVLGHHTGYLNYTIGQRRGLNLGNGPWYVERIDSRSNTVVVARREDTVKKSFTVERINWFIERPDGPIDCTVKVRYQSELIPCRVFPERNDSGDDSGEDNVLSNDMVRVEMERGEFVTPGQSAVFYSDDLVIGGGFITSPTGSR